MGLRVYGLLTAMAQDFGEFRRPNAMDLNSLPLFRAMAKRMAWLGERQQTLAQNVANADTPGYVAQDLKAQTFRDLVGNATGKLQMTATQPLHLAGVRSSGSGAKVVAQKSERAPDGNSVDLEKEMMKVSETATDFNLVSNLYRQHIAMMKAVLGRSSG
jgi:flagellar basal-body rod protein FlgB